MYLKESSLNVGIRTAQARHISQYFKDKQVRILELGSGNGKWSVSFKRLGYYNLIAVDRDGSSRGVYEQNGIDFKIVDLEIDKIPYDDSSFDAIVGFDVIEHIHDCSHLMKEVKRVLKDDGILILETPDIDLTGDSFWNDSTHVTPYDTDSLNTLYWKNGIEPLALHHFNVRPPFGLLRLWKMFPSLLYTGDSIICIGRKAEC